MILNLKRIAKQPNYTIGRLFINTEYFCDTVEDTDRSLKSTTPLKEIKSKKIQDKTAIPIGIYDITLDVISPRFSQKKQYSFCQGKLPKLLDVPGYDGVLIHIGNSAEDSSGCILVGKNKQKGKVLESTTTFTKLYNILKQAKDRGEKICIEIE